MPIDRLPVSASRISIRRASAAAASPGQQADPLFEGSIDAAFEWIADHSIAELHRHVITFIHADAGTTSIPGHKFDWIKLLSAHRPAASA